MPPFRFGVFGMLFEDFKREVGACGLQPIFCNDHHWQIAGGKQLVNFWPRADGRLRFAVDNHKAQTGTLAEALKLAGAPVSGAAATVAASKAALRILQEPTAVTLEATRWPRSELIGWALAGLFAGYVIRDVLANFWEL